MLGSSSSAIKVRTGIRAIRMLYLQLLYGCNFAANKAPGCLHCFHGDRLKWQDAWTLRDVRYLLQHFTSEYRLSRVTYLGGEPFMWPDIAEGCRLAKEDFGLGVEICTNGHSGFIAKVEESARYIDRVRVSLEGLEAANDLIRQRGSFQGGLRMLDRARELGIHTGVTVTVNTVNLADIAPLAKLLEGHGVEEMKLHCLRLVGSAAAHPELEITNPMDYDLLRATISAAKLQRLRVIYDSDLSSAPPVEACANLIAADHLDRIEADPQGGLTVSCKAVGKDVNAFRWNRETRTVDYEPQANDELSVIIPDVVYLSAP